MRDRAAAIAFVVICVGQLIGWGSASVLSVGASTIAAELGLSLPATFAGNTVFFVVMGLAAPLLSPGFTRHGARPLMVSGALVAAGGHGLLSVAQGPVGYFSAWAILGLAGAACLSTAAHILLSERWESRTGSAISALMLVTGLSASIFLPANAFLIDSVGWRGTCIVFMALMIAVAGAYHLTLPRKNAPQVDVADRKRRADASPGAPVFLLIAASITLSAFVTFGLSALLIELLVSQGLAPSTAVLVGSGLGVVQVGARGLELVGKGRIDAVTTGLGRDRPGFAWAGNLDDGRVRRAGARGLHRLLWRRKRHLRCESGHPSPRFLQP